MKPSFVKKREIKKFIDILIASQTATGRIVAIYDELRDQFMTWGEKSVSTLNIYLRARFSAQNLEEMVAKVVDI